MPFIGKIMRRVTTFDHQVTTFDATEELILLGQDHAFVKKNEQVIGIVCLDSLLEEYKSGDISDTHVAEYLEPLFFVNEYEDRSLARSLMKENNVEHIAVTNQDGIFLGIASAKEFKEEP